MSKRNLLICFDAFGTLFKPRRPIAQQYGEVATSLGLRKFGDDELQDSFRKAFKNEAKQHPNFGKASGMDAEKWWSNIIRNTFQPLIPQNQSLPPELVPRLLHRFWSDEGYVLFPDVKLVLRGIRNLKGLAYGRVVVGVITNSDDRVTGVLSSLGVRVHPLRFGKPLERPRGDDAREGEYDVDFAVMSYDVGHEKPDARIFAAAEELLEQIPGSAKTDEEESAGASEWDKVYVGDEYEKDVVGALNAGWHTVLISDEEPTGRGIGVRWCDNEPPSNLSDLLAVTGAVGFSSFGKFAQWLR